MTRLHRVRDWTVEDIPGIAKVEIASWRAAYGEIIESAVLDRRDFARIAIRWQRAFDHRLLTKVAEVEGEVAGFASRDEAEITMLYVDPRRWRQGIGRALLSRTLVEIAASRAVAAWLWVLAKNETARQFYVAQGGVAVEPGRIRVGTQVLDQIRYCWDFSQDSANLATEIIGR